MNSNSTLFCSDEFWIPDQTWYSPRPRLTRCLANVGVSILPSLALILIGSFEFLNIYRSTNKCIHLNKLNVTRFLICLCLFGVNLITLVTYMRSIVFDVHNEFTLSDFFSCFCKLLISVFLAVVSHYHRTRGVITSGIIFVVNLLLSITSTVLLLDVLSCNQHMYADFERQNIYRNSLCVYTLLLVSCFADDAVDAGLRPASEHQKSSKESLVENIETELGKEEPQETVLTSPRKYCSFLSRITFFWYSKFIQVAARRQIELSDIWEVEDNLKVENASKEFNEQYYRELDRLERLNRNSEKKRKFNIWSSLRVIRSTYGWEYLGLCFVKLIFDSLNFVAPKLLSQLINFVKHDQPIWQGCFIIFGLILSNSLKNILINYYFENTVGLGIRIKSAFTALVFSKSLKLAPKAKKQRTTGEVVNLISVDTGRFADVAPFLAFVWSSPFQIGLGIYLLWEQLDKALFAGVLIIVLVLICNSVMMAYLKKYYLKEMKIKDERVKLISEVLSGMKIIKLYGWEKAFIEKIKDERQKEVKCNKKMLYLEIVNYVLSSFSPTLVLVATIGVYIWSGFGDDLTAEKIFVSIALFNLLQFPIELLPVIFTYLTMCKVSLDRISSFLAEDELEGYVNRRFDKMAVSIKNKAKFVYETNASGESKKDSKKKDSKKDSKQNGKIDEVKFSQNGKIDFEKSIDHQAKDEDEKPFELKDIELEVQKGQLIAVIGQVGAGKTSLISAILGEMHLVENDRGEMGSVNISEEQTICYVAQQAWIQNNTLRENILFGKPFNRTKYDEVISACCLDADLKQLDGGDLTEIGEKGINLSGGQKQRVSLARACYASVSIGDNKQIILLDDVLSAVDAHVGKSLCEGVLNSKTGILRGTTRILVTNQLNQLSDLDVDQIVLLKDGRIELKCTYDKLMEMERDGELDEYNLRLSQNHEEEADDEDKKSEKSQGSETSEEERRKLERKAKKLIEKERHEVGRVDVKNYLVYLKWFGISWAVLVLISLVGDNFFSVYSREFLSQWSEMKLNLTDDEALEFNKSHFNGFLIWTSLHFVANLIANILMVVGIVNTLTSIHSNLLFKIMRSPMSFFDTTPIGRIINRFSNDIESTDKSLPRAVREFLMAFLNLMAALALILYKQPSSFIFYFLILVLYYFILDLYVNSSRQLKRFDSSTKSPIYSHFSETIAGSTTIRAFGKTKTFETESKTKMEVNNRANWYSFQGNRWLSLYLDLTSSLILLVVTIQFVFGKESTTEGEVGLITSYALNMTASLTYVVRFYSLFESNLVSVERINEYLANEEEDEWVKDVRPAVDWPRNGEIEFIDYSTRYREGTSLVLKDLNFKVDGAEKVGVVGRTGAGKSSMTLALFRIIEPVTGRIVIDGVDISKIGLHDLKSRLSIIPQDAVLFTGTIRFNLDPFSNYTDDEIYRALEHAHLKDYIKTLEGGIEHKISEGGENLSVGQRQLICLARALLRKSKILVLDEATASVDFATDELVQNTIRSEFKDCTTITIAHRLKTVLDSSRILVLDRGELAEYDSPESLLKDSHSMFYSLAAKANVI